MIPWSLAAPPLTASLLRTSYACHSPTAHSHCPQQLACRRQLADIPMSHVWPYQEWLDADRACFMSRQYIHSSLFQRLSTRPFLTQAEKAGTDVSKCSTLFVIGSFCYVKLCICASRHQRFLGGAPQTSDFMLVQPAPALRATSRPRVCTFGSAVMAAF